MPTLMKFFRVEGIVALNSPVLLYFGSMPRTVFRWTS